MINESITGFILIFASFCLIFFSKKIHDKCNNQEDMIIWLFIATFKVHGMYILANCFFENYHINNPVAYLSNIICLLYVMIAINLASYLYKQTAKI
jgi:hypothetical protein